MFVMFDVYRMEGMSAKIEKVALNVAHIVSIERDDDDPETRTIIDTTDDRRFSIALPFLEVVTVLYDAGGAIVAKGKDG